jgi:hypothetical protein
MLTIDGSSSGLVELAKSTGRSWWIISPRSSTGFGKLGVDVGKLSAPRIGWRLGVDHSAVTADSRHHIAQLTRRQPTGGIKPTGFAPTDEHADDGDDPHWVLH